MIYVHGDIYAFTCDLQWVYPFPRRKHFKNVILAQNGINDINLSLV